MQTGGEEKDLPRGGALEEELHVDVEVTVEDGHVPDTRVAGLNALEGDQGKAEERRE